MFLAAISMASLITVVLLAPAIWAPTVAQSAVPKPATLSNGGSYVAARTPYTVVLQESTRGPSGDASPQGTMTMAMRRDGAFVVQYEHLAGPSVIQRTIELPTGGTVVVDDVRERRTSRLTRVGASFRARMDPARGCIKSDVGEPVFRGEVVSDRDLVAGHETVKVRFEESTFWFARHLGCANVKTITRFPSGGVNEKIPVSIVAGDPAETLFYVPDRYPELAPSVFFELDPHSPEARAMDRAYFERRPAK